MDPIKDNLIVIIDDNLDNVLIFSSCLEDLAVSYISRASGFAFFKYLDAHPHQRIALILLDINLPIESGFEVIARIRNDSRLNGVSVVAVTASDDLETEKRAAQMGFDGFFRKPIDIKQFPDDIKRILATGIRIWQGVYA